MFRPLLFLLCRLLFLQFVGSWSSSPPPSVPCMSLSAVTVRGGGEGGVLGLIVRDGGVGGVPLCSSNCSCSFRGAGVGGVVIGPARADTVLFGSAHFVWRCCAGRLDAAAGAGALLAKKWWRIRLLFVVPPLALLPLAAPVSTMVRPTQPSFTRAEPEMNLRARQAVKPRRPNSKRTRRILVSFYFGTDDEEKTKTRTTVPLPSCIKGKPLSFAYSLARSSRRLLFGIDSRKNRLDFTRLTSRHLLGSFFFQILCSRRHHLS